MANPALEQQFSLWHEPWGIVVDRGAPAALFLPKTRRGAASTCKGIPLAAVMRDCLKRLVLASCFVSRIRFCRLRAGPRHDLTQWGLR